MERKLSKRKLLRRKYKHYAAAALAGAAIMTGVSMPATTFAAEHHPVAYSDSGSHYDTRNNSGSHYDTRYNSGSHYDTKYNNGSHNDSRYSASNARYDSRSNGSSAHYDTRNNSGSHYDTRYNSGSHYDTRYDGNYRNGWHRHDHSWPSSGDNQALYKNGRIYYSNANYNNSYESGNYLTSPVTFAREYASSYGFDGNLDTFSLLNQSSNRATVQVIKHDTNQTYRVSLVRSSDGGWSVTGVRGVGTTAAARS